MLTDIHTHAFRPDIAEKAVRHLHDHYGINPRGNGLMEHLLERLRKAGIERCAVHTAAMTPHQVHPANEWALELNKSHPEVVAFGSVHPDYPDWEMELDQLEAGGVKGIKLHPDFQHVFLDDPRMMRVLEAMQGRFIVMVHVGDRPRPKDNPSCPMKVMHVKKNFPRLDLIAAHMGGYLHWKWARECLIGEDVYIDTSSSLAFMDDETLFDIFKRHPREKILFGSDYPVFDPLEEAELLKSRLKLSAAGLEELMRNSDGLLG